MIDCAAVLNFDYGENSVEIHGGGVISLEVVICPEQLWRSLTVL